MALEAKNVSFRYEPRLPWVLQTVSLKLERGARTALFAPSGYGKTTLAMLLAGYLQPTAGEVLLDGAPLPKTGVCPVQLICQHPEKAINPRWRLARVLEESGALSDPVLDAFGIERAWQEIAQADRVLFMVDGTTTGAVDPAEIWPDFIERLPAKLPITVVRNKADVTGEALGISEVNGHSLIRLSARTGDGVEVLRNHLKQSMGFDTNMEGGFLARRRHLQALEEAANHLQQGKAQLLGAWAGELLAEELRLAQQALSEITGEFTSDDLLGRIFSSFCIGK